MDWNWKKVSEMMWHLDEVWTVEQHRLSGRWYATRSGEACLVDCGDAGGAMVEAERLRKTDKLYK